MISYPETYSFGNKLKNDEVMLFDGLIKEYEIAKPMTFFCYVGATEYATREIIPH